MIAEQEQIERSVVVASALASQRLEGLEPDSQVIEDAGRWARGEMSLATAIDNYKERVRQAA